MKVRWILCTAVVVVLVNCETSGAWSNRGHRMVNEVAAESLPPDMPAFMRSPAAIAYISYLGPEPDRWRPETAPELSGVSGPDHFFRYEAAVPLGPLPRRRYDYLQLLEQRRLQDPEQARQLTAQYIGTLPWAVDEVYERLVSAFVEYRLVKGELPAASGKDMAPMSKEDLPYIEANAEFYAGWMGHYVADGCMPLHSSVNIHGWEQKDNPNSYTTRSSIHHQLEQAADDGIAADKITAKAIEAQMAPAHIVADPFDGTMEYLRVEGMGTEQVYRWEKQGVLGPQRPAVDAFIERQMADGGAMLRDLIYSAWEQSKDLKAPPAPATVTLKVRQAKKKSVL